MEKFPELKKNLYDLGFTEFKFRNPTPLHQIQEGIARFFDGDPTQWHKLDLPQEAHVELTAKIDGWLGSSDLVTKLVAGNLEELTALLGPDISIQTKPYLRLSRPARENDFIDWHRDTFYGNSPYEMNIWFPVYQLAEGAGLRIVKGSQRVPSRNQRHVTDTNPYRQTIARGSVANQIGYQYAPKTDDVIEQLTPDQYQLVAPPVGSAILFFGSCIHRAQNNSTITRLSIDTRVKSTFAGTNTKEGYYKVLTQGLISRCADEFGRES